MRESVSAACIKSLCQCLCQAEKGTLSPLECLSFANTIQADYQPVILLQAAQLSI